MNNFYPRATQRSKQPIPCAALVSLEDVRVLLEVEIEHAAFHLSKNGKLGAWVRVLNGKVIDWCLFYMFPTIYSWLLREKWLIDSLCHAARDLSVCMAASMYVFVFCTSMSSGYFIPLVFVRVIISAVNSRGDSCCFLQC